MGDEVVATPFGKFLVNDADIVESTLKAETLWDGPGFLQVIAREYAHFREDGVTIIDVGAHVGSFSIWCAAQDAWRVLAVEPVPKTMQRLKANLDLNKGFCAAVVIPIPWAAYDRECRLGVGYYDRGNTGGTRLFPLDGAPATTVIARCLADLSPFCGHSVSLVKIDAEGCDGRVIRGLEGIIEWCRPTIVFEWDAEAAAAHNDRLEDVVEWLVHRKYSVHAWPSHPNNYLAVAR